MNVDAAALDKCDQVRQYPTLHGWHDDCPPGVLCPHDQAVRLAASASASEFAQSCSSHVAIMGGIVSPWRESRHSARSFEMSSKSSAATQVHARSTAVNETSRVVAPDEAMGEIERVFEHLSAACRIGMHRLAGVSRLRGFTYCKATTMRRSIPHI